MQPLNIYSLAAAAFLLSACNQPAVTLKSPAFQASENTVRDWQDVAHKITQDMIALGILQAQGTPQPENALPLKPVFVRVQSPDSTFVQEVAQALESDILSMGGSVARKPGGASVVNLDVKVVRWGPHDKPQGLLGTIAAVTAIPGVVIADSLPMSTWTAADTALLTTGGLGVLSDGLVALWPSMNAEAVWEATIVSDDRVLMRLQEPVYVRAADIPLYAHPTNLSPIVSSSNSEPLSARLMKFAP